MKNVDIRVKGDKIIIEIDRTKTFGPSRSGKTIVVATTSGNHKIDETDCILGLNCYKKT